MVDFALGLYFDGAAVGTGVVIDLEVLMVGGGLLGIPV